MNIFDISDKIKVTPQFKIKDGKNNRVIVGQWTITDNIPIHIYLLIVLRRTILTTNCSDNDCRTEIQSKKAPCCGGN